MVLPLYVNYDSDICCDKKFPGLKCPDNIALLMEENVVTGPDYFKAEPWMK